MDCEQAFKEMMQYHLVPFLHPSFKRFGYGYRVVVPSVAEAGVAPYRWSGGS